VIRPLVALALLSAACGGATPGVQTANIAPAPQAPAQPYPESPAAWGEYRSVRNHMTIPLPSPAAWKIDDRSRAELVATEASTHSTLVVLSEVEPHLVNHEMCEARARELGLVPAGRISPIEDVVTVGPEAYDTRVRVGIQTGGGDDKRLVGHVLAFGAYVRKCLVVHLATEVGSEDDEQTLSQRLALARVRTVGGIKVDLLATEPDVKGAPR